MWSKQGKIGLGLIISIMLVLGLYHLLSSKKINEWVVAEAGSKAVEVSEFIIDKGTTGAYITDISKINMNETGVYNIKLKIGKKEYSSKLEIKDTIAPTAKAVNQEIWPNEAIEANKFVEDIIDVTEVKVSFKEQPDYSKPGLRDVFILLVDSSGNQTELKAKLSVKADVAPPEIIGAKDQSVYIGDKISYKKDVVVTDNRDEKVELMIDSSAVNLKKVGSYKVVYYATDKAGNKATKTVTIQVKEKPKVIADPEELNQLADTVLANIITNDMTDVEKLWAIYKWTRNHITYTGSSDKSDWVQGAIQGIKKGSGDCFNYYATSRILLTRAGFENQVVVREGGATEHFWNLVKVGDSWYHFDTTWTRKGHFYICFLRTDAEVEEYTKTVEYYYKFDKSKHPATPEEPLEIPFELKL